MPVWAKEFALKYGSNTSAMYILHGNIRDFLSQRTSATDFKFTTIQNYIADILFGFQGVIINFDRSSGITFYDNDQKSEYIHHTKFVLHELGYSENLLFTRNPISAFQILERYFFHQIQKQNRIVLIIDYAETLIPSGELNAYSDEDRYCIVTLKRWATDPIFINNDVTICLLTENLSDINNNFVKSPNIIKINIPIPDEETRRNFFFYKQKMHQLLLSEEITVQTASQMTGGLNLVNINQIIAESYQQNKAISLAYLKKRKKELIEAEASGLLEFIESKNNLEMVSGHAYVVRRLKQAASTIQMGKLDVLPMGYLISGPVGTGKSYMVTCFSGDVGIPCVKFLNFRSKWQGVTEANIEKILNILKAMAPVAVMIDEADAFLGDRSSEGDSGTSSRVFGQLANFMGNTEYRGKIIWFLITCRPDLIPIDIKRQGRAEEHLALFYPETIEEKLDLFYTLARKLNVKINDIDLSYLLKKHKLNYSGADIEAILVRAKFHSTTCERDDVYMDDIEQAIIDFIPPSYPYEVELQNLVSILECTSKQMIPKEYANLDKNKIAETIKQLKILLGEWN